MIHRYTLFGNPVEHSLSPRIHTLFGEQAQRRIEYTTSLSSEASFGDDVFRFRDTGAQGCNVTVPFKELACELCDSLDDSARIAGACNTIKFLSDGKLAGYNTDGSGLLYDLKTNIGLSLDGKTILILGAGGATRGVLEPLLSEKPSRLVVANRTVEKAQNLAKQFAGLGDIEALSYDELQASASVPFDLVINATSASLQGEVPPVPVSVFGSDSCAYDFYYSREAANPTTAFTRLAADHHCKEARDGIGMLLEQAADAFFIWQDVRPKTRMIGPKIL